MMTSDDEIGMAAYCTTRRCT